MDLIMAEMDGIAAICMIRKGMPEVMRLIATGNSNKAIAQTLRISQPAVKSPVSKIFIKLNLASRTRAAFYTV
jgi:DNA-binding NarL/FixJ family response regulator